MEDVAITERISVAAKALLARAETAAWNRGPESLSLDETISCSIAIFLADGVRDEKVSIFEKNSSRRNATKLVDEQAPGQLEEKSYGGEIPASPRQLLETSSKLACFYV